MLSVLRLYHCVPRLHALPRTPLSHMPCSYVIQSTPNYRIPRTRSHVTRDSGIQGVRYI